MAICKKHLTTKHTRLQHTDALVLGKFEVIQSTIFEVTHVYM